MRKRGPSAEEIERREREDKRIANQRNLFTFLPVTPSVEALKQGMLQRAYDLLCNGDTDGCDAILEFLPSKDVLEMLDAWTSDQEDEATKSKWY